MERAAHPFPRSAHAVPRTALSTSEEQRMSDEPHPLPPGQPHLRTVAMPRDANPSGDIFGGWTVSQMDLAGATFAVRRSRGRVATVAIEAMRFLRPIAVGDEVSCYCALLDEGEHSMSVKIETWASSRAGDDAEKVTEGVFAYVAVDEHGKPREVRQGAAD
jgi:acyl-CoA thioesterase YciA